MVVVAGQLRSLKETWKVLQKVDFEYYFSGAKQFYEIRECASELPGLILYSVSGRAV